MNWALVLMLSSVIFLGGCVQNESQPSEIAPAGISEFTDRMPPTDQTAAGPSAISMSLRDKDLKTNFGDATAQAQSDENIAVAQVDPGSQDSGNESHITNLKDSSKKAPIHQEGEVQGEKSQERLLPDANSAAPVVQNKDGSKPKVVTTGAPLVQPQTIDLSEVTKSVAYTNHVIPLLQKIRSLNTETAVMFENRLKGGKLYAEDSKLVSEDQASVEFQAQKIVQALVVTQSILDNEAEESKTINELYQRSKIMAANLLKNRDRMNTRFLYENLVYAKISTEDWKFETLTAIEASSVVLNKGLTRFRFMSAEPKDEFNIREAGKVIDNCRLSITYQGAEKGTLIRIAEPEWREFEITMDFQKPNQVYNYKPSLAGEQYKELEVLSAAQALDKSVFKLSLRFVDQKNQGQETALRRLDHVLLEKLSAEGKAERSLMCRVLSL